MQRCIKTGDGDGRGGIGEEDGMCVHGVVGSVGEEETDAERMVVWLKMYGNVYGGCESGS